MIQKEKKDERKEWFWRRMAKFRKYKNTWNTMRSIWENRLFLWSCKANAHHLYKFSGTYFFHLWKENHQTMKAKLSDIIMEINNYWMLACVLVAQSCLTLCDPLNCSPKAPLVMGFSRQEYWSGRHSLLQGIFPTLGSNPGVLHCRQILYHVIYQGSPY